MVIKLVIDFRIKRRAQDDKLESLKKKKFLLRFDSVPRECKPVNPEFASTKFILKNSFITDNGYKN